MKIIVAPDKFKGSLSSLQACDAIRAGILQADKNAVIHLFPMADGGDGFADVLKYYLQTTTTICKTVDPLMRALEASYEWNAGNKTAIIELASASGLMRLKEAERNPMKTSTYGTGLLIKHAIDKGALAIIVGVGGSASNDAGIGILAALGFQFTDAFNTVLSPAGENLLRIKNIIPPSIIPSVQFTVASDVQNILFGTAGAAAVYAPQKGADENAVRQLDEGLKHFAEVVQSHRGRDIASIAGAGAGGGVAAGLSAYFDLNIIQGAKMLATAAGIENEMSDADLVITGEGRLDGQTANGKVVQHIASLGGKSGTPVLALCGETNLTETEMSEMGLTGIISLTNRRILKDEAIANAGQLLSKAVTGYLIGYKQ